MIQHDFTPLTSLPNGAASELPRTYVGSSYG